MAKCNQLTSLPFKGLSGMFSDAQQRESELLIKLIFIADRIVYYVCPSLLSVFAIVTLQQLSNMFACLTNDS